MVLGKLPVPGRPTNLDDSRARAYCACSRCGWGLFGHFYSQLSFLSPSLWEMARYRLKYCLKGPLNPKQPTNQLIRQRGWSGGTMVQGMGKLSVPGRPTLWITIGQGPTALAVGAGGDCLDIFTLIYPFSPVSPSLWETARYRLKYCLKGLLNPKTTTTMIRQHISCN